MEIKDILDEAHREAIRQCLQEGHTFTPWEDTKFITASERTCTRCKLFEGTNGDKGVSQSFAIGSTWPSAASVMERYHNGE